MVIWLSVVSVKAGTVHGLLAAGREGARGLRPRQDKLLRRVEVAAGQCAAYPRGQRKARLQFLVMAQAEAQLPIVALGPGRQCVERPGLRVQQLQAPDLEPGAELADALAPEWMRCV